MATAPEIPLHHVRKLNPLPTPVSIPHKTTYKLNPLPTSVSIPHKTTYKLNPLPTSVSIPHKTTYKLNPLPTPVSIPHKTTYKLNPLPTSVSIPHKTTYLDLLCAVFFIYSYAAIQAPERCVFAQLINIGAFLRKYELTHSQSESVTSRRNLSVIKAVRKLVSIGYKLKSVCTCKV